MSKLTRQQVMDKFKDIKLLALDVDGVLTNDSIYFGPDGFEMKQFNTSDGLFMVLGMRSGLELAIVSGRYSQATDTRMKDLGVKHVLQAKLLVQINNENNPATHELKGTKDKVQMIQPLLDELDISFEQVAFVGNEILDLKLAAKSAMSFAVADSSQDYIDAVDYVTEKNGGCGAVREVIELYLKAHNIDPKSLLI